MNKLPVGLLLAAGKSTRFGSNKLLHKVIDGTPMLLTSAKNLVSILPRSIVIISKDLDSYQTQLEDLGLQVVINKHADNGMGSSIACGVRASQDAMGWLIALADMPYIKTNTIKLIVDKLCTGAKIVAPRIGPQRGHPVGFDKQFRNALLALNHDVGASYILEENKSQIDLVATDDVGVLKDIDREVDIA